MARRKTVKLRLDVIGPIIKEKCRSYTVFCEKMERTNNWATNWMKKDKDGNPTPKNLPSPEEAARMCAILQVTPEQILTEPEDIALVQALIDSQRPKKEEPAPEGELFQEKLISMVQNTNDPETLLAIQEAVAKRMRALLKND